MSDIPWRELLVRIAGVAIMAGVVSEFYRWATRFDLGGPFSGVLSAVGVTGPVKLALLGGGLLVVVGWILVQFGDSGFRKYLDFLWKEIDPTNLFIFSVLTPINKCSFWTAYCFDYY